MTQQEKYEKCDCVLRAMYKVETGQDYEPFSPAFTRWISKNHDRLCDVIRRIMKEEGVDNG